MTKLVAAAGVLALGLSSPLLAKPAGAADLAPAHYEFTVRATPYSKAYQTEAYIYAARTVMIYALLSDARASRSDPIAASVLDVVKKTPGAVVANGGFSSSGLAEPAGLLMVKGRVISPLSRARNAATKLLQLSGVMCERRDGGITIMRAEDTPPALDSCRSALQAGPLVVEDGQNGIHASEMAKPSYLRTMIGTDKRSRTYLIVFTRPVHLHAAADFLRGVDVPAGARPPVMLDVLNLDGDGSTVLVQQGRVVVGDPSSPRPSALVVR